MAHGQKWEFGVEWRADRLGVLAATVVQFNRARGALRSDPFARDSVWFAATESSIDDRPTIDAVMNAESGSLMGWEPGIAPPTPPVGQVFPNGGGGGFGGGEMGSRGFHGRN